MSRPGPLRYLPSLDGLRALAVVAVIVYHANPRWLPGGFIGVETFFVISGYLITLLLVSESEETGRVDLRAFWVRRARRLLPALWLLLIGVTTYAAVFERGDLGRLRGDVVAAVLYGFNWFQIWTGTSYFTAFELVPLRHLWSLAVEEQYYLVWPLVMAGVLALGRRRLPAVGLAFAGGSAALAAWTAATYRPGRIGTIDETPEQYVELLGRAVSRIDLLFLGTPTRAAGLLLGAALATWWRPWRLERAAASRLGTVADVLGAAGTVALVVMALRFHTLVEGVDEGTVGYDLLFRGGFAMVDVASLAVVAAAAHPGARLTRLALGNAVMRWIGTRSYGLYLYHWPIYLTLTEARTGLSGVALLTVRIAVSVAVAAASYHLVEMPIRHGALRGWARVTGAIGLAGLIVAATVGITYWRAPAETATGDIPPASGTGVLEVPVLTELPPLRVMFTGDSLPDSLAQGFPQLEREGVMVGINAGRLGCGFAEVGDVRVLAGLEADPASCGDVYAVARDRMRAERPDVLALFGGVWEMADRRIDGTWYRYPDPVLDQAVIVGWTRMIETARAEGVQPVILTTPYFKREALDGSRTPDTDPARVAHLNGLLRTVGAQTNTPVIDTNAFLARDGDFTASLDGRAIRAWDGTHFTPAGAYYTDIYIRNRLVELVARGDLATPQR